MEEVSNRFRLDVAGAWAAGNRGAAHVYSNPDAAPARARKSLYHNAL